MTITPVPGGVSARRYIDLACLLIFFLSPATTLYSQTVAAYKGTDCNFTTLNDVNAGCTSTNYLTVQYGGFVYNTTYAAGWTLKVKANADFSNGSTTIPAQYVSIAFNSANGGPSGVSGTGYQSLSTGSAAALITTSASLQTPPVYYFEHRLNMKIQGGAHLTVGTGTYSAMLTLTLADKNGNVIATKNNVAASFIVTYSNSCGGATLGSYSSNQHSFTTYSEQMSGATTTDAVTIQYNPNAASCSGWSLKARAASNFINGASSVSPQYFALAFNRVSSGAPSAAAIGVSTTPIALSMADVTLIDQSNAAFVANSGTVQKFDMVIQGGNHLLVPNGTYSASIIFTLYNQASQVVSTTTVSLSFAVNSTANSYTAVFQNAADDINLSFDAIDDYVNGVSVTKNNGFKVTGYNPYQVVVKTSGGDLVSGSSSNTIPVSVVSLEVTRSTATSAGINVYTRELSTADQVIITNPLSDYTQQVVEYNLRYYTQPGDTRLSLPQGVFNTSVLFVVIPQ